MRKSLVVVQFFITQLFIIGVIVMSAQVKYLKTADTGFDKDQILMVKIPGGGSLARQNAWLNELDALPEVKEVTLGVEPPMSQMETDEPFVFNHRAEQEKFPVNVRIGDSRYVKVFGLKLLAGRNFASDDTTRREALVNETMVKQLGIVNPADILNKNIRLWDRERTIVGVVRNFTLDPLSAGIQPAAIVNESSAYSMAAVKLQHPDLHTTLPRIEKMWNKLFPEGVYQAGFLDDKINDFYATEHILLGLIQVFSGVAIAIGCLGLYGLVTFMAESRAKEIGVRKVLGATESQVLWIFGKEFSRLMVTGFLLAAPLGWFLMKNWLQRYAYKIELGWWVLALTAGAVGLITALTVSFQSIRAARRNPVVGLRSE